MTTVGSSIACKSHGRPVVVRDHGGERRKPGAVDNNAAAGESRKGLTQPVAARAGEARGEADAEAQDERPAAQTLDRAGAFVDGGRNVGVEASVTTVMMMEAMKKPTTNFGKRSQITPADGFWRCRRRFRPYTW